MPLADKARKLGANGIKFRVLLMIVIIFPASLLVAFVPSNFPKFLAGFLNSALAIGLILGVAYYGFLYSLWKESESERVRGRE